MKASPFALASADRLSLHVHRWQPDGAVRSVVQIVHGMGEHGARYERLARALCAAGCEVLAMDGRGHGRSALSDELLGHLADQDGFGRAVGDVLALAQHSARERPAAPRVLLGHSLGSLVALAALERDASPWRAAALSGTSGDPGALRWLMLVLARLERLRLGARGRSALLNALLFGRFNRPFEPAATPFDWLSRDPDEVAKYVADPLCGFVLTVGGICDLAAALGELFARERLARIPRELPLYLFCGERDPVHAELRGFDGLVRGLRAAGLERVETRVYPGARHETLNETNRDEVTRDLLAWLDGALATPGPVAATPNVV